MSAQYIKKWKKKKNFRKEKQYLSNMVHQLDMPLLESKKSVNDLG